jgi:hypothetical protein
MTSKQIKVSDESTSISLANHLTNLLDYVSVKIVLIWSIVVVLYVISSLKII